MLSALDHPLPEIRVRSCWLIGKNSVSAAVNKLISMVESDPDLFVRSAAVQSLGELRADRAVSVLERLTKQEDVWMREQAQNSLRQIQEKASK